MLEATVEQWQKNMQLHHLYLNNPLVMSMVLFYNTNKYMELLNEEIKYWFSQFNVNFERETIVIDSQYSLGILYYAVYPCMINVNLRNNINKKFKELIEPWYRRVVAYFDKFINNQILIKKIIKMKNVSNAHLFRKELISNYFIESLKFKNNNAEVEQIHFKGFYDNHVLFDSSNKDSILDLVKFITSSMKEDMVKFTHNLLKDYKSALQKYHEKKTADSFGVFDISSGTFVCKNIELMARVEEKVKDAISGKVIPWLYYSFDNDFNTQANLWDYKEIRIVLYNPSKKVFYQMHVTEVHYNQIKYFYDELYYPQQIDINVLQEYSKAYDYQKNQEEVENDTIAYDSEIVSIDFDQTERNLYVIASRDKKLKLLNIDSHETTNEMAFKEIINVVGYEPVNDIYYVGGEDKSVTFVDGVTFEIIQVVEMRSTVNCVGYCIKTDEFFIGTQSNKLHVIESKHWTIHNTYPFKGYINCCGYDVENDIVFCGGEAKNFSWISFTEQKLIKTKLFKFKVVACTYSFKNGIYVACTLDSKVNFIAMESYDTVSEIVCDTPVRTIGYSDEINYYFCAYENTIAIIHPENYNIVKKIVLENTVNVIKYNKALNILVAAGRDNKLTLIEPGGSETTQTVDFGDYLGANLYNPEKMEFLISCYDTTVYLVNTVNYEVEHEFEFDKITSTIGYDYKNKCYFFGGEYKVFCVYYVKNRKLKYEVNMGSFTESAVYNDDTNVYVVCSFDSMFTTIDVSNGNKLNKLRMDDIQRHVCYNNKLYLTAGRNNKLSIIGAERFAVMQELDLGDGLHTIGYDSSNKIYFCGGADCKLTFIQPSTWELLGHVQLEHTIVHAFYVQDVNSYFVVLSNATTSIVDAISWVTLTTYDFIIDAYTGKNVYITNKGIQVLFKKMRI